MLNKYALKASSLFPAQFFHVNASTQYKLGAFVHYSDLFPLNFRVKWPGWILDC